MKTKILVNSQLSFLLLCSYLLGVTRQMIFQGLLSLLILFGISNPTAASDRLYKVIIYNLHMVHNLLAKIVPEVRSTAIQFTFNHTQLHNL